MVNSCDNKIMQSHLDLHFMYWKRCCFLLDSCFNSCHAEKIKMPYLLPIISQSDYLIQVVDINSHTE